MKPKKSVDQDPTGVLRKKTYALLVVPNMLILPTCHGESNVSNEMYDYLYKGYGKSPDIVLAPSDQVPTIAALVEACGGGRVDDGPWNIVWRCKRLVTVLGHADKDGRRMASTVAFQQPPAMPNAKDVKALKDDFARYARTKPRGLKFGTEESDLKRLEANQSVQEVIWWFLSLLSLSPEERIRLAALSIAEQVKSLRAWLTDPARAADVRYSRTVTSKDEEFLQAIIQDPDSDAPRLVYADWLEEKGDPRSTFIRVQCELAHLAEDDPRRKELEKQDHDLLDEYRKDWEEPFRKLDCLCLWRRGFVTDISVPVDTFLKNAARIFALAPIQRLSLKGLERQPNELLRQVVALPQLQRVRRLEQREDGLDDESAAILAGSANLANLTHLGLFLNHIGPAGAEALAKSPHLAQLTDLELGQNPLTSAGARALAASKTLRSLTELTLRYTEIGDAGVIALAGSRVLDSVRVLHLWGNEITARGARALAESPHVKNVTILNVISNRIGDTGAAALVQSKTLRNLTELDISHNEITNAGVRTIAAAPSVARLKVLSLGGNDDINDKGAAILAKSEHLANIKRLSLFQANFGDEGIELLQKRFGKRLGQL